MAFYLAGTKGSEGKGRKIVYTALESGIRLIDTAQAKEWYVSTIVNSDAKTHFHSLQSPSLDICS